MLSFAAAIIISREIWVGALRDLNARTLNTKATKVLFISKIKTTIQLFTICLYLVGLVFKNMLIIIADIFVIISVITLYTGYLYTYNSISKVNSN